MTVAFFSYVILTTITPGPNNIMSMTNASKYGFMRALRFCLGVLIGFTCVVGLTALLCSYLFSLVPIIKPYMAVAGAAYILFLAYKVVRDKPHTDRKVLLKTDSVFTGVVLQFINVKGILYAITVVSTYILPMSKTAFETAILALFLGVVSFLSTACWALFGSVFERLFSNHKRIVNAIMALLLVYCAVTILITTL